MRLVRLRRAIYRHTYLPTKCRMKAFHEELDKLLCVVLFGTNTQALKRNLVFLSCKQGDTLFNFGDFLVNAYMVRVVQVQSVRFNVSVAV